jgi:hypothetical protein
MSKSNIEQLPRGKPQSSIEQLRELHIHTSTRSADSYIHALIHPLTHSRSRHNKKNRKPKKHKV